MKRVVLDVASDGVNGKDRILSRKAKKTDEKGKNASVHVACKDTIRTRKACTCAGAHGPLRPITIRPLRAPVSLLGAARDFQVELRGHTADHILEVWVHVIAVISLLDAFIISLRDGQLIVQMRSPILGLHTVSSRSPGEQNTRRFTYRDNVITAAQPDLPLPLDGDLFMLIVSGHTLCFSASLQM